MIRRRGANWHIVWREGGRKVERSLGTADEAEARRLADALTSALAARRKAALLSRLLGDAPQIERRASSGGLAMRDALDVARRHRALGVEHEREWLVFCAAVDARKVGELAIANKELREANERLNRQIEDMKPFMKDEREGRR